MSHARIEPARSCLSVNYNETATDIINCNPGKRNKEILDFWIKYLALPKRLKYVQPGQGNPGKRHKEILDFMDKVLGIAQKPNIKYVQPGQVFSVCNVFFKY